MKVMIWSFGEVKLNPIKILLDTHSIKTNTSKSWVSDIEFARMETLNSRIPDASFLVLKIDEGDDIRKAMEAPTPIKSDGKII